jgi:hypothetical protein
MTPGRGRVLKRLLRSLVLTAGLLSLAPGGLAMSAPWTELSSEGGGSDDHGNSAFWRISSAVEPLSGSPSPLCDAFRLGVSIAFRCEPRPRLAIISCPVLLHVQRAEQGGHSNQVEPTWA